MGRQEAWPTTVRVFTYFRLTADNRILFGGWDALYHFGSDADRRHEFEPRRVRAARRTSTSSSRSSEGIKASHTWGRVDRHLLPVQRLLGHRNKVVTVTGFTGLGVGASHFGAAVALDLLDGCATNARNWWMVKSKPPIPFPPEPARWIGVNITRHQIARSERRQGKRDCG